MAPPIKPESERKSATGVSLTHEQRAMFLKLGGSKWLQAVLDAHMKGNGTHGPIGAQIDWKGLDKKHQAMDAMHGVLENIRQHRRMMAMPIAPAYDKMTANRLAGTTPMARVKIQYPQAKCVRSQQDTWRVYSASRRVLGRGPTPKAAWADADANLTRMAVA